VEQDIKNKEQTPQEATTVGMFLKFTRQNQKKSIEAVAKALCIRKIYIKAIEESDFVELPPVPYGLGFVRSYASFLGLNADRIAQCYKEEAMPNKSENEANKKPIVKKHTALTIPNRKQILIAFSLVLGLYFITLAISYHNSELNNRLTITNALIEENASDQIEEKTQEENIVDEENVINTETTETSENEIIKVVEESYEEVPVEPSVVQEETSNKILVKFKDESWIEVRDENKVYISGIYQKGFEYEIPVVSNLTFSVGRYFNVDVFINGKLTKVAGPKKQTNIKLDKFLNH
jgi:hypothetical protein